MSSGRRCVSVLLHPQVDVVYYLGEFRHAGFHFRAGEGVHRLHYAGDGCGVTV